MHKNKILKIMELSDEGIICRQGDENLMSLCKKSFKIGFFKVPGSNDPRSKVTGSNVPEIKVPGS